MITGRKPTIQSFEDAVLEITKLQHEANVCLGTIREKGKDLIRVRFRQGQIVSIALRNGTWGDRVVPKLAQSTGINETTLFECRRFFELPEFHESPQVLEKWIEDTEERKGTVNWTYCRNLVHKALSEHQPEEAAAKLEKQKQELERKAQKLEQDAEDLQQRAANMPVSEDSQDEALGVAMKAQEVAGDVRSLPFEKPVRVENPRYLAFVRSHPCLICSGHADPHHIIPGGMGTKAPDYHTVPLCRTHHNELHNTGAQTFWQRYSRDPWKEVALLLTEWLCLQSNTRDRSS